MATLCWRIGAGLRSINKLNSPLCTRLCQVKCPSTVKDGCMVVFQRGMAGGKAEKFFIQAPKYSEFTMWKKFFRYMAYTGIPLTLLATFVNVFIGNAQFREEIPEGYEPKHWEYYEHPISRFIIRYMISNPQRNYEKKAHFVDIEQQRKEAREEYMIVKKVMKERGDGWSYQAALNYGETSQYKEENP